VSQLLASLRRLLWPGASANRRTGAPGVIRRPLSMHTSDAGLVRFHLPVRLRLRTQSGAWEPMTFLVDTEAEHTYIPVKVTEGLGLPLATDRPCHIVTRTGTRRDGGYFSPLAFAFDELPDLMFQTTACFARVRQEGEMPLIAGSDLLRHFTLVVTAQATPNERAGFLLLHLRDDHAGTARS
jgi:hypothetical protein